MTHYWLREETRPDEGRSPLTPEGAARLMASGAQVTVEDSAQRLIPTAAFAQAGCTVVPGGQWRDAPETAVILGLKELPSDDAPLRHAHVMFAHAYKGQPGAAALLSRFRAGGGTLLDLEYLTDADGRRVAAFGYWAGYAGAAVTLLARAAQATGRPMAPLAALPDRAALLALTAEALGPLRPSALVIGALGRVGRGAADLCAGLDLPVTRWDIAETASGGPFPQILEHEILLNCILAAPQTPVFVAADAGPAPRALRAIGDIACDPDNVFTPIKVNDRTTTWAAPARRVWDAPPLDVVAIDNLPSLLPRESTEDFAAQLLPHLLTFAADPDGIWGRARTRFAVALSG
ncbi:saccharopine dehydrogenase [Limimaricola pyoseonensis]|uniref:Saccharopine dehydrogenase [NAD(+), L-lysine-forming] n=1 Tax=Limimaricola pyoseonensis TaxID=521013 RepID=A0A1G7F688_9RHOB|nr:saccharopine dehydrogenase [Limimaricola pyoseonensis]SDE71391.1 saccharopine dehydrogenase (NAD+, L-lysine-forming) [Limimaricola pyoseonensis]